MVNRYIKNVEGTSDIIELYPYIKKIPLVNTTHREVLKAILSDHIALMAGYKDDELEGILIVKDAKPRLFVVGVYGPKILKHYITEWYDGLRRMGYTTVEACSGLPRRKFERATQMKKVYSVYRKEL